MSYDDLRHLMLHIALATGCVSLGLAGQGRPWVWAALVIAIGGVLTNCVIRWKLVRRRAAFKKHGELQVLTTSSGTPVTLIEVTDTDWRTVHIPRWLTFPEPRKETP
ncbi:hypothetical protein [Nesterenkonia suensis]